MTRRLVVLALMALAGVLLAPPLVVVIAAGGPGWPEPLGIDLKSTWPLFLAGSAAMMGLAAVVSLRGLRR